MKTTLKQNLMTAAVSLVLGATLIPAYAAEQTTGAIEFKHRSFLPMPNTAGRLPLGRHAQRHCRPLAQGHQSQGRDSLAVHPRD